MSYTAGEYAINPALLGVDFTAVDATPVYKVGEMVETNLGNVYQYVSTTGALVAGKAYGISKAFAITALVTTTTADTAPLEVGVPAVAVSTPASGSDYFWIQRAGNFAAVLLSASCAPDVELYTTATGGEFDDAATVGLVEPLKLVGSAIGSGASANGACFAGAPIRVVRNDAVINA